MAIKTHHAFPKGKKLYVIMRNGEVIIDKYIKVDKAFLYLKNHKLRYEKIRSTGIYKNKGELEC